MAPDIDAAYSIVHHVRLPKCFALIAHYQYQLPLKVNCMLTDFVCVTGFDISHFDVNANL